MTPIILKGKSGGVGNADRITYLTTLINNVVSTENHVDNLRQRNITIALALFAALVGFGLKFSATVNGIFVSLALAIQMLLFCILDRKLHKASHGWRGTRWQLWDQFAKAINCPEEDISVLLYDVEAEKDARWFKWQPMIYYFLILGGGLSFFMFR